MKKLLYLILLLPFQPKAQAVNCTFKQPLVTIHFGRGNIRDLNSVMLANYERVASSCPTDGHYTYTSYTSDCFRSDWFTLPEDHTPGDVDGNMLLVNASHNSGAFLNTAIPPLKTNTTYEFAVWMMNLCKITEKCPFPLLPSITIRLQTPDGKVVAQFPIGELARSEVPHWTQYRGLFTAPASETSLILSMIDTSPGGCGNDFALDDITFRECIKQKPPITTATKAPVIAKQKAAVPKAVPKKATPPTVKRQLETTPPTVKRQLETTRIAKPQTTLPQTDLPARTTPNIKHEPPVFAAPPRILTTRANALIKQIETEAGEISLDLYDNGEIDGDTVSIYHNNVLLVSHTKLSEKPISFRIVIDSAHPHHEFIMVAHNLGSIPPNTSLMVVKAGTKRYEVFISSTEQKNAKVILNLKE